MKVGDLVQLPAAKRRLNDPGFGIVLKVAINKVVTVDFGGVGVYIGIEHLEVISESR